MTDAPTNPFQDYTFSTDYAELWKIVQTKAVICLADRRVGDYHSPRSLMWWEYNTLNKKVRLSQYAVHPDSREHSLPVFWTDSVEEFIIECKNRNLQWLVPRFIPVADALDYLIEECRPLPEDISEHYAPLPSTEND